MWLKPKFPTDFVTFAEEILSGKLHFLCSDDYLIVVRYEYPLEEEYFESSRMENICRMYFAARCLDSYLLKDVF